MKRKISLSVSLFLVISLVLISLVSCGGCTHRDADDNSLCDLCGESYTDGCDDHRDADDDGVCDNGGESYTDGCDNHRDADDDGVCDNGGESYTDGCDNHRDADDDGVCDNGGEEYSDDVDIEKVTVSFNTLGGTTVNSVTVNKNSKLTAPLAPTKDGYIFNGWKFNGEAWDFETDTVAVSITLTADWTPEEYTITINLAGGIGTYPDSYTILDSVVIADPTRDGYTFEGWVAVGVSEPIKNLVIPTGSTGDKEYTATWKPVPFSIEIDLDGGSFGEGVTVPTSYDIESGTITISAPSRVGYDFEGWSVDGSDELQMEVVISEGSIGNKSISASWKPIDYNITLDTNDGDEMDFNIPTYNIESDDITVPTPTKRGYTFTGWLVNDSTEPVMVYVIRQGSYGHLKLKATWELTKYTITYKNTQDAQNLNPEYYYMTSDTITLKPLTKDGYIFGGWLLNGVLVTEIPTGSVGNITLTARFTADIKASVGLAMTLQSDDTYAVSGIGTCSDTEIVIPLYYNDKPVTAILANAFKNNTKITKVHITDNIKTIGQYAFQSCTKLKEVIIGEGVTSIANYAFYSCTALTKLDFNAVLCSDLSSSNYAFYNAGKSGTGIAVSFGANVTRVPAYLFYPYSRTGYEPNVVSVSFAADSSCTQIGTYAFYNLKTLASINLPDTLVTLGNGMLYGCSKLTSVKIPDSVTTIGNSVFGGCTGITSITIPAGVTTIGSSAFSGCTGLTSITIPEGVTSIGSSAFSGCTMLTTINFNAKNLANFSSNNYVFSNAGTGAGGITLNIGKGVTRLPDYVFSPSSSNSPNIIAVNFAKGGDLTEIGACAFYYVRSLPSVTIPAGVTSIGRYAFGYCSALTYLRFEGGGVIGSYAFAYCSQLAEIAFAGGVTETSSSAFVSCNNIKKVYAESLKAWCAISFYDYQSNPLYYADEFYVNGALLTDIVIPEGVTSIGNYSFYGFAGATKLELPSSLKVVGKYAFGYCTGLTEIKLGGVETIGEYAFASCTGVKSLTVPASVKTVGSYAFSNCKIEKVACESLAAWCAIDFGSGSANPAAITGALYFNDAPVTALVVPDGVSEIGNYAFYKNAAITSIDLNGVTSIGNYAFAECEGLLALDLKLVKTLGNYAFYKCSNIKTLDLGDVESLGSHVFWSASSVTSLTLPDSLKTVSSYAFSGLTSLTYLDIGKGVTTIYENGFYACTALETLVIPDNVAKISEYAFRDCTALKSIRIGKGLTTLAAYAFWDCTKVTDIYYNAVNCNSSRSAQNIFRGVGRFGDGIKVIIGKDVVRVPDKLFFSDSNSDMYYPSIVSIEFEAGSACTEIGQYAFADLYKLTSVKLPDGLKKIGSYAFESANKIKSIVIPDSVEAIDSYAFRYCNGITNLTLGKSVKTIGAYAFASCAGILEITVPEGVTEIAEHAFDDCRSATKIKLPSGVTSIGQYAFYNGAFTTVEIPEGVTTIAQYAFANSELVKITIPNSVTGLGSYVFNNCRSLTEATLGTGVSTIPSCLFKGCENLAKVTFNGEITTVGNYAFGGCAALLEIKLGDALTSIGTYAFDGCTSLKSVSLGTEVSSLGQYAFQGCAALVSFTVPEKVTSINRNLFSGCSSLSSIVIHDAVTYIDQYAFSDCTGLESVTIGKSVTSISNYAFSGCTAIKTLNINARTLGNFSNNNYVFANAGTAGDGMAVVFGAEVTRVPNYLFAANSVTTLENAPKLSTVTFEGTSCTSVGMYAFAYVKGLKNITLPANATLTSSVFFYCVDVEEITLPLGITTIPSNLFYFCSSLERVNGTDKVTAIESSAFYFCSSLKEFDIREGVTTVGQYAFYGCEALKEITLPSSLTSLGSNAFYECRGLETVNFNMTASLSLYSSNYIFGYAGLDGAGITVNIGKDVTAIPNYMFSPYANRNNEVSQYTAKIVAVNFAEDGKLISIGQYAFAHNEYLMSITLPASLNSIGNYAFFGCTKLIEVTNLSESITVSKGSSANGYVGYYARNVISGEGESIIKNYNGLLYYVDTATNTCVVVGCDDSLTELKLPDTIEGLSYTIRSGAFKGNGTITKIVFADGITEIGSSAYYGCVGITEVVIPDSVTSIGSSAFYGCTGLKTLTIGKGVTFIGTNAFKDCKNLTTVNYNAVNCQSLTSSAYAFDNAGISGDGITVTIGKGVTAIPGHLFNTAKASTAPNIVSVVYEDGSVCTSIGVRAFAFNPYLKVITIPESITTISGSAFTNCTGVETIYFNAKALTDLSSKNLVFSDLGQSTDGVTVIFGEGVTRVPSYLFDTYEGNSQYAAKIISIELPASIETVGRNAFAYLRSLTTVKLNSAIAFDVCAFKECDAVTELYVASIGSWLSSDFADTYVPLHYNTKLYVAGEELSGRLVIPDGVTQIPDYAFYGCMGITEVVFPESVTAIGKYAFYGTGLTKLTLGGNIDTIDDFAFYYCKSLASVTIGSKVSYIGEGAFQSCSYLGEIFYNSTVCNYVNSNGSIFKYSGNEVEGGITLTFGKDVTTIPSNLFYMSTTNIYPTFKDIIFEEGSKLETVGAQAFSHCAGLTSITLPASVKSIGSHAFAYCTGLKSITLNEGLTVIDPYAFEYSALTEIVIPDSVITVGSYAFGGCTSLTRATIGKGATTLQSYIFNGTTSLVEIVYSVENAKNFAESADIFLGAGNTAEGVRVIIASSVTRIPEHLFYAYNKSDAMKIVAVEFEDGSLCEEIAANAFCSNIYITEIALPDGLKTIKSYAFQKCTALAKLSVPDTLVFCESDALYGCTSLEYTVYEGVKYLGNENNPYVLAIGAVDSATLVNLTFHEDTRVIGPSAFQVCHTLESVVIGNKVVTVGDKAFQGCSALASIKLGSGLKNIGNNAFYGCAMTSLTLDTHIESVGSYAFANCTALTELIINTDTAAFGHYVFSGAGTAGDGIAVTFGSGVTKITQSLFYYSSNSAPKLASVDFDENSSCTVIEDYAFKAFPQLASITLPDTLEVIGYQAFSMCTALTEIALPASLNTINNYAFSGCTALASVSIEDGLETLGQHVFENCKALKTIFIPNSVTLMGRSAFVGCSALESITLPFIGQSLQPGTQTHIGYIFGDSEFTGSYSVSVKLGNSTYYYYIPTSLVSVTVNGGELSKSFWGCRTLNTVTVGEDVTAIHGDVFTNCTALASFNFRAKYIEEITNGLFYKAGTDTPDGITVTIGKNVTRIPSFMFATSTDCGTVKSFTFENGCAVKSIGESAFFGCSFTEISLPESVTTVEANAFKQCTSLLKITLPEGVKAIGAYAFEGCTALTTVRAMGVTEIGCGAFTGCTSLTTLELGDALVAVGDSAFSGCTVLATFVGGKSLKSIGEGAFSGCKALVTVSLPDTLESIGQRAFEGCSSLGTLYIPGSIKEIAPYTFASSRIASLTLGDGIETIGSYAFDTASVANLYISDSVNTIGAYAFRNFGSKELVLGRGVTTIGSYAFTLSNITSIAIPTGVTKIADYAFYACEKLESVTFHNGITEIGKEAFRSCEVLAKIELPASLTTLGASAFYGCIGATGTVVIPDGLVRIENYTFSGCKGITAVSFGSSLTYIGNGAFDNCRSITEIDIPDNVGSIGWDAFADCRALTSVTIGLGVDYIGQRAFENCTALTSVTFKDTTTWWPGTPHASGVWSIGSSTAQDTAKMAKYLTSTYVSTHWCKE